ncbi:xanthine dehydrogenase molybdopterin binding subunit [Pleomorphomonas diazotrophica]|uniref:Xanthine dehydrogenase molybdopterin binding subunit n=1 Tax=Pleomorphomonas diazotrophica TaxID=1166257 RepID=A0A1I4UBA3_9HYPH|nr:xanthine dehydrogenase molybdopterin binding subunit [Pleomorphomonas diazotrophica]PKR91295.1 xanthine dehydrogenase molybdopterin binding subunit [Pleomorphomonas diazotrophica]SFM86101.1 xanthine dehydrogenase, molybdenum binding subunit apoprotein [Pleomorphomonas diazotrophica]
MNAPESETSEAAVERAVHRSTPHDSAVLHVTGRAVYIDDMVEPTGTLHLAPGFCPDMARGRIRDIDLSRVRQAPGVVAVLTAADIPGRNDWSTSIGGDPIIAENEVEFWGEVLFCVVAETRDAARRATRLALFEGEAEPPVLTAEEAKAKGLRVLDDYGYGRGDVARSFASAQRRFDGVIRNGGQEHFYLEGQVALAIPGETGDMHVYSSTQHPSEVQHCVAHMLGVPNAMVTVEVRRMGGGFGGKESQASQWACLAALGARVTGRPCKLRLDRDDDMVMTGKRHDMTTAFSVAYDSSGKILAADIDFMARCGYSADLSGGVNDRTLFHADNAYFYPNVALKSERLKTNTVTNTAFRGFGGPQGILAAERIMDTLAIVTGIDPLEIRKRNFYGPGRDVTPYGQKVEDNILPELIADLERSCDYAKRRQECRAFNSKNRILRKGIALTPIKFGIAFTLTHLNQAGALVHVYADGSVHLNHGGTEMGQGLNTKVAQVAADAFGLPLERVRITATNTSKVPNTSATAASSGSDLNGMAALAACNEIKERMVAHLVSTTNAAPESVVFADGRVSHTGGSLSFADLAKSCYEGRVQLSAAGFYSTPKIHWDRQKAEGRPFLYFAYGAACAEVTIDTMTGEMKVDRVDILHDCGRSLNPAIDIGQIEGAFVQGMGWLTTEELVWDDKGRLATHAPSTYKIPTASDVPAIFNTRLWDGDNREETIHSSKAVGEPPLMLACSVFSAIFDAVASLKPGVVPPLDAPATPESIMRAVAFMRRSEA